MSQIPKSPTTVVKRAVAGEGALHKAWRAYFAIASSQSKASEAQKSVARRVIACIEEAETVARQFPVR